MMDIKYNKFINMIEKNEKLVIRWAFWFIINKIVIIFIDILLINI